MTQPVDRGSAAELAALIEAAERVVALTGAGISTASGIPDFRTPGTGLWANVDPMAIAHIDVLNQDPATFWRFYSDRFTTLGSVKPNRAHQVLVELEEAGRLEAVITQNVDRLHGLAGTSELIELHGSIDRSPCTACGAIYQLDDVRTRASGADDGVPECDCGAMIRPGVVLFGEMLPQEALGRAFELAGEADLILCIGSSLEVHPAAGLPLVTAERGGTVAILTESATPLDDHAAIRLHGDVVAELEAVLEAIS